MTTPSNTTITLSPTLSPILSKRRFTTPTIQDLITNTGKQNKELIKHFHETMKAAKIANTNWFNLAILGNGTLIIEGGAAVNLIVLSTLNNPNTPLDLKNLCEAFLHKPINKVNDLDILLETTPTQTELTMANPEIPAKIEETRKNQKKGIHLLLT